MLGPAREGRGVGAGSGSRGSSSSSVSESESESESSWTLLPCRVWSNMAAISALANLVLTVGEGIFLGLGAALGVDANRQLIHHSGKKHWENRLTTWQMPCRLPFLDIAPPSFAQQSPFPSSNLLKRPLVPVLEDRIPVHHPLFHLALRILDEWTIAGTDPWLCDIYWNFWSCGFP